MQFTQQDGVLLLQGELTVATLTKTDCQALLKACQSGVSVVDLSGVTKADSACVALLVGLKRQLGKQSWQLRAVPMAVTALLELYELAWLK